MYDNNPTIEGLDRKLLGEERQGEVLDFQRHFLKKEARHSILRATAAK